MPSASLDDLKEEIKARVDLADLIGGYGVHLKRAGRSLKGLSPFQKEKTPSFVVHPEEQFYKCFSSGEGGDAFSFIMKMEGVDFMTAMKILAKRAGVPIEDRLDSGNDRDKINRDRLYGLLQQAADAFRRELLEGDKADNARNYLSDRDLLNQVGEDFLIGYAPDSFEWMKSWGQEHGFSEKEMIDSGMLSTKENDAGEVTRAYDRFRDRVMFPIRNEIGRVIGFSGRVLNKASSPAKYVNSPETPLFRKSRVLYGLDRARSAMVNVREALVCEGQIDVIRCHQHGFETAVAAQGTAITEDHAGILKRYADRIVLVMDSDKAGQKAALRSGEVFLAAGLSVTVARLPEGDDPDTILSDRGKEEFQLVLDQSVSLIEFQYDQLCQKENPDDEASLSRMAKQMVQLIQRAPSAIQRDQLTQKSSQLLGISADAFRSEVEQLVEQTRQREARNAAYRASSPTSAPPPPRPTPTLQRQEERFPLEESLAVLLLHHPDLRESARLHLGEGCTRGADFTKFLSYLEQHPQAQPEALIDALESELTPPFANQLQTAVPHGTSELGTPKGALQDMLRRIHVNRLQLRRAAIQQEMQSAGPATRDMLIIENAQLTMQINDLRNPAKSWEDLQGMLEAFQQEVN